MANEKICGIGFHHIGLKTKDLARSVAFYEALGMKEIVRWGEGEKEIVMLDIGDGGRFKRWRRVFRERQVHPFRNACGGRARRLRARPFGRGGALDGTKGRAARFEARKDHH